LRLCLATNNQGKINEYKALLDIAGLCLLTPAALGVRQEVQETGSTFAENALIKARELCHKTSLPVLADDSGLCVKALGQAPGVYSARYGGGLCTTDTDRCRLVLEEMAGVDDREASFVCVIAVVLPDGTEKVFEGQIKGLVACEMRGANGFGYDPLFYIPSLGKHMAQLSIAEKDTISHRAVAAAKAKLYLQSLL
jgi:XTP/dITP diphosphohydrolase